MVGFLAYMYYPENHFALEYQKVADCQRQKDIHRAAELIERYFELTGHYPLDSPPAHREISVILTEEALPRQFKVNPPPEIRGELIPAAELKRTLEQTLKEKIRLPADPQTAFAWGSRYYLYRLDTGGNYSLSATLFSRTTHTLEQDRYRHSYHVGSKKSEHEGMRRYIDIAGEVLECAAP